MARKLCHRGLTPDSVTIVDVVSDGINTPRPTIPERILGNDRLILIATLGLVTLACWSWIVPMAHDMYGSMSGSAAWMMTDTWDMPHLLLLVAMWIVMMAGMMLPSATPTLLVYAAASRRRSDTRARMHVYAMAGGYLVVWIAFSLSAAWLQRMLSALLLVSPMMKATSPLFSGALLIGAGIYSSPRSNTDAWCRAARRSCF